MSALKQAPGSEDHILGDLGAAVGLVEYGDYQCPHCRMAHPMVKRILEHFGEKMYFVFRNFPLNQTHRFAQAAAETAEFAGAHGKFWQMQESLFENQERFADELFPELAAKLDLDPAELELALREGTYTAKVRADFSGGARSGVNGTPTFFLNGARHNGPSEYDSLARAIDALLVP